MDVGVEPRADGCVDDEDGVSSLLEVRTTDGRRLALSRLHIASMGDAVTAQDVAVELVFG
ncbi:hypothetical protein O2W15_16185 [Modestobacter sp. VKM Ac-2979]|uniref:hypothetical protein n=1 Tax=unclassified Modestobacter TaxID=2643866 RepID=UPI0022AB6908|nr:MULTISPECIES: hypothetical protein [unclassified Modestobacter]MCZ2812975.1 hypothetical protein [Modestobacter sp. VKM Ac-2979]MCZ2842996.1 hypothetical protein [Modestobacter sp. VKM Ac-2980]